MILETIVTTRNADGSVNIAPMGPHCDDPEMATFELRPFCSSKTWQNLKRTRQGILHITDDVRVFARAATGVAQDLECEAGLRVDVDRLADCCRYYEFRVTWLDESRDRASLHCRTVHAGRQRDFLGFQRARHAVIEAAILATRIDFLPLMELQSQFEDLERLVIKTGGIQEQEAFRCLQDFLQKTRQSDPAAGVEPTS